MFIYFQKQKRRVGRVDGRDRQGEEREVEELKEYIWMRLDFSARNAPLSSSLSVPKIDVRYLRNSLKVGGHV